MAAGKGGRYILDMDQISNLLSEEQHFPGDRISPDTTKQEPRCVPNWYWCLILMGQLHAIRSAALWVNGATIHP